MKSFDRMINPKTFANFLVIGGRLSGLQAAPSRPNLSTDS